MLDYVDGLIVWPDHFALVESDSALAEVASLIRNFHDAAASFNLFDRHAWSDRGADPVGPHEILCHNDLAPWNLVRGNGGDWTFIDWDLAAPGRRSWDIAWALLSFAPLMPDRGLADARIADEDVPRAVEFRGGGPGVDGQAVRTIAASLVGVRAASA